MNPLPDVKVVSLKTPQGNNTGVLNVVNFVGARDKKILIRKIKGDGTDNFEGSVDGGSLKSSAIGTELNRKITDIKKKTGARVSHVRRYSGVPLIHPTN